MEKFENKSKILKANAELTKETSEFMKIHFTPDLTKPTGKTNICNGKTEIPEKCIKEEEFKK